MAERKIRMGMIGGGPGSFIGAVHRMAANLDGEIELVSGCFSSDPAKSKKTGRELFLPALRVHSSYKDMIRIEKNLPELEKMDFVSIVTPNYLHFDPAKMALENGFHVLIDKPITMTVREAKQLKEVAEKNNRLICLTHTYSGYPMIKQARQMLAKELLGAIRKIIVEYPQGWLSTAIEETDNKQATWRTNPKKTGVAGAMGDIGTHAFHLAEYVSGLQVTKICADLNTVVKGRKLDDDGNVLLQFNNGANGVLIATQIAAGEDNNIRIRIYGEKGGMEWQQDDANSLQVKWLHKPMEIYKTGAAYLSLAAKHNTRIPPGHPEGYLEAFANHYRNFALTIKALTSHKKTKPEWLDFPSIDEGIRGMAFIENVVASAKTKEKWFQFKV
ncbi:MAG: Gfo/Idh/MocA family oxidoreductase [Chitinophagaceae bacterium]|nr:Gfo/Idh/MocA family oxidoreductase [Chitinophagaceae bacterium]